MDGDEDTRQRAFSDAALMLGCRIDLLLALPFESLERMALEYRLRQIGEDPSDGGTDSRGDS